jgi:pyruvate dehydrogenase E2 component (dihydrolipoamide acetyltransferase)
MDEEKKKEEAEEAAAAPPETPEEPPKSPEPPPAEPPKKEEPEPEPKPEPKPDAKTEPHPAEIALAERLEADIAALPEHAALAMREILGITGPLVGMRVLTALTRHQIVGSAASANATSPGLAPDEMAPAPDPGKINWQAASAGLADRLRRVV